jgi:hypothetical protein
VAGNALIALRRDVAADWTAANPVLALGEPGWETDTAKLKVGDGVTAWNSLAYFTVSASVADGDKGDITVTASGATWTIDAGAVSLAKMANVATATVFYRKTAGTGVPEVQTLATLKTDLGLTGTNSGDQTSITGITGSVSDFNTALTGADFYTSGGTDVALADGGTGASLTDPNADRVLFWDDSLGAMTWLTMGTNLTITGTTLDASGGGGLSDGDKGDVVVSGSGATWTVESANDDFEVKGDFVNITGTPTGAGTIRHTGGLLGSLILENTGGTYGTSRLSLKHENNENGAIIETVNGGGIDLTDLILKTAAGQQNLRLEHRSAQFRASNLSFEFQLGTPGPGVEYVFGDSYAKSLKPLLVPDEAYDATAWNGSLEVPTKNAVRDKIETLANLAGGNTFTSDQTFSDDVLFGGYGSVSVATPNWISLGGKYANARGGPVKIKLHDDGVTSVGFGYSYDGVTGGFDYTALAGNDHSFYVAGTRYLRVDATGLLVNGDVTVADEAYGAGWNASLEVPTKNAVYDKIETLQPLNANLTQLAGLADPNADRLLFWDDSAGAYTHLTLGTNLSITGTTIDAAGGSGSPGGSDRQIQFNNSSAFGGAAALDVDTDGNLRIDYASAVTTPGADQVTFVPQRLNASGGRVIPRWRSEDAVSMSLATHPGRNTIVLGQALGNATTAIAPIGAAALTAVGTASSRNVTTSSRLTRAKRLGYVSAGTAGSAGGLYNSSAAMTQWTVGGASGGGFMFIWRGAVTDSSLVSGAHCIIGMRGATSAPAVATNPNTLTNIIALCQTNGSANWQICYGGSAAQTPVDTGIAIANTDLLEFIIYARPDVNNKVTWRLENISTGAVASGELTGTAGTALPANTQTLGPIMWRSNNATAAATAIDISSYYIESDFA